jgi:hypothetical protein
MTHSAGYMTPIDGERWSVHAPDGRQLARHGCAAAAQLHLIDLALSQDDNAPARPWTSYATTQGPESTCAARCSRRSDRAVAEKHRNLMGDTTSSRHQKGLGP